MAWRRPHGMARGIAGGTAQGIALRIVQGIAEAQGYFRTWLWTKVGLCGAGMCFPSILKPVGQPKGKPNPCNTRTLLKDLSM
eukprot:1337121-Amorphochlora_amoeboformis.AAC.2